MADTQLQQLVINELTKAQYEAITPEPNQLYMVTDEDYLEPSDIATSITAASTNAQVAGAKAVYDAIQSGGTDPNAVHYTAETKTTEEKAQARSNIGAGTYSKPASGIPASDIATGVIPDVSGKEDASNKVTSMTSASTDTQYPSAKAVYDALQNAGNPIVNNSVENHGLGWKVNAINFTWDKVVPTGAPTTTFSGTTYYLISELAPSKDSFTYNWQDGYYDVNPKEGVSVYRSNSSGDPEIATPLVTFDEKLLLDADGAFMIATVPGTFTVEEESIIIPKAGIWAQNSVYTFHSLTAPETYSTIDPNFIPAGSTDNPILTNAIETNGIGWKESALEEAYIEWEGDTEGRASIDDVYYQVYSGAVNHLDFIGGIISNSEGAEEVIEQDYIEYDDLDSGIWYITGEYYYCVILEKDITIDDQLYHPGIYFFRDGDVFTNYIEWVSQDIYNKINVDYLPSGGIGYVENSLAGEVWYGDTNLRSHHSLSDQFITILNNSYKKVGSATPLSQILVDDYGIVTTNDGWDYLIGDGSSSRYFVIRNQTHIAYSIYDSLPGAGKIAIIVVQNPGEYYIDNSLVYTFTKEQIGIWMVNSANLQGLRWGTSNNIAKIKKIDATYLPIIPYTKSEIDDKVSTLDTDIRGKANTSHKHSPIDCSIGYGGCDTAIDTAAKVVSNLSGYSLNTGSIVCIHFMHGLKSGTSAQTLNINNTGARPITYSGESIGASGSLYNIPVYSWVTFIYDDSNFEIITWNNRRALTKNALTFTTSGGAAAGTTFDGSAAKTISYATVGAAASSHTHNYAGSSSAGGAATSANKVNAALTFSNGGSGAASGTTFDGSTARTISYNSIGAAASSHSHAFADLTSRPSYAGATMTGSTAIPEVKTATWDAKQNALTTQTAYSAKGSATKVPQITTNSLGQVTGITEVTITQPTVNNGTLTIQKNGTSVGTFTANQSTNSTVNITVPTYTAGNYITIGTDNKIGINITTLEQKLKDDGFITCLIEGTKIAMADGSTKNIEDVNAGDLIKSYDPTTKQTTTAMALTCEYTGTSNAYIAWITETGDSFEICGPHWIWNEDANCIFSSVAGAFKIGTNLRTLGGASPLAAKEKVQHTIFRRHYLLISSNNLYYANNILVGHWDAEKYNSMRKIDFANVPEEIITRWHNNAESYDRLYNWATDPAVVAQCIPLIKQINAAKSEIEQTKQQLAEEDYKDNKATEAFITAFKSVDKTSMEAMFTGIASVIEQFSSYEFHSRDEKRAYINQKEAEIAELDAQLDAAKLGIEDKAEAYPNISVLFINTVHEGDADFEALQTWAANLTNN